MKSSQSYNKQLKPCPQCNGKAQITTSRGEDYCLTGVSCTKCDYHLETREDTWGYYYAEAVEEWNDLERSNPKL